MRRWLPAVLLAVLLSIGSAPVIVSAQIAPSGYVYALLSRLAYEPDIPARRTWLNEHGWQEFIRSAPHSSGYFGVAYANPSTRQMIIAHRGTDEVNPIGLFSGRTDLDDDLSLFMGKFPKQWSEGAQPFINRVKRRMRLRGWTNYTISHTGHSLGGALAELSATAAPFTSAVTFDSPGVLLPVTPQGAVVRSYLAAPNFINTVNGHPGQVVLVDNWRSLREQHFPRGLILSPLAFFRSFIQYSLDAHRMERILGAFNEGGDARQGYDVAGWWPRGLLASFSNYLFPKDVAVLAAFSFNAQNVVNDPLEQFLDALKQVQTEAEFQAAVDEYVVGARRLTDNLSDVYTLVIANLCQNSASCAIRASERCFPDADTLSYQCVRDLAD